MPVPILQSLIRTYFFQRGLDVLFGTLQVTLKRPSGKFMGELKPGMHFRTGTYRANPDQYDLGPSDLTDITILGFREEDSESVVEFSYTFEGSSDKTHQLPKYMDFYI